MGSSFELLTPPIKITAAVPVSDDEFIAFSRANRPYRFEKNATGEIVMMTPAGNRGDEREADLVTDLNLWARTHGGGRVNGPNAGWNLPDGSTRSPDASWTSDEQLAHLTAQEQEKFLPICPDFVVEIRSQSDSISAVHEKMAMWMTNGARLGWLIDPFSAIVHIYRPGHQVEVLHKPTVVTGEGPIAGFRLEMERFWA